MKGKSFVSFEHEAENAYFIFLSQVGQKKKGLCITREHPSSVKEKYKEKFEIFWMNQKQQKKNILSEIEAKVKSHLKENPESVILLERIDYLINIYGFEGFLRFIYTLNEEILESSSSIIVHSNPNAVSEKEKCLLQLELKNLPKPDHLENIRLAKDLYDILEFVKRSETKVSFKSICKKIGITKATARKRVYELNRRNLVIIKKDGRSKIVELTKESKLIV